MADESNERTHAVLIGGDLRFLGKEHSTKRRPISAGSLVSRKAEHKASDDHVLNSHEINAVSLRLDRGPWAVLEERRSAIVRRQQPAGEDGVVRIPHVVGAKLETYRDNEEWVIVIETCHQCESHRQEWLRHDPQDYRSAIEVVRSACQKLNRAEPLPCFQMNTPDLGQRMGALEVFLLPPKISPSVYVGYLLHSKLLTRKWPSQHSLLRRMQVDMPELDFHGWKSALHGFKGDIFNSFKEAQEEIKRKEEKASIAEKRIVDLEHEVSGVPGLQQRVEQLEIQNLELTTNLETSNGWLKFSFSENQQMKELSLTKESEAQASIAALEEKLRVKEDTIKDLEGSLVALQTTESKNQALEKELESIRVQRQEDCHYIRSQEDEKRSLTAERDDQRAEASHLKQELDDMKKKLEEIQQDVKAKDQRLHQIPELELKVQQLENDKLELTESLQVCQKQKFVAETEQKSMNRVLLSNSLREKELQKELWLLEEMRTSSEGQLRMQLQELEQQLKERDATIRDLATSQAQLSHTAGSASQALQNELERLSMERSRERQHVEAESQSLKVQAILDGRCEEMQAGPAMEVPISIKDDATRQEDELEDLKDQQRKQDLEVEEVHEGIGQALDKDEAAMGSPVPAIPEVKQQWPCAEESGAEGSPASSSSSSPTSPATQNQESLENEEAWASSLPQSPVEGVHEISPSLLRDQVSADSPLEDHKCSTHTSWQWHEGPVDFSAAEPPARPMGDNMHPLPPRPPNSKLPNAPPPAPKEHQTDTVAKDEGTDQEQQTEKAEGTDQEQQTEKPEGTDQEHQTDTVAKDEGTDQEQQTEKPEGTDQEQRTDTVAPPLIE